MDDTNKRGGCYYFRRTRTRRGGSRASVHEKKNTFEDDEDYVNDDKKTLGPFERAKATWGRHTRGGAECVVYACNRGTKYRQPVPATQGTSRPEGQALD